MSRHEIRIPRGAFAAAVAVLTVLPLVELALLVALAGGVGWGPTLLTCAATGFVGAWLARWQGVRTALAAQEALAAGSFPGRELLDGAFILAGGVVLLTPGLLTDAVGLALLVPPTRRALQRALRRWWDARQGIVEGELVDP